MVTEQCSVEISCQLDSGLRRKRTTESRRVRERDDIKRVF